jgi:hypothetical protein
MVGHLALDAVSGLTLLSAPFLWADAPGSQRWWLVGLGLFEVAAALISQTTPGYVRAAASDVPRVAGIDQVVTDQTERAAERADQLVANSEPINQSVADRAARPQ